MSRLCNIPTSSIFIHNTITFTFVAVIVLISVMKVLLSSLVVNQVVHNMATKSPSCSNKLLTAAYCIVTPLQNPRNHVREDQINILIGFSRRQSVPHLVVQLNALVV